MAPSTATKRTVTGMCLCNHKLNWIEIDEQVSWLRHSGSLPLTTYTMNIKIQNFCDTKFSGICETTYFLNITVYSAQKNTNFKLCKEIKL